VQFVLYRIVARAQRTLKFASLGELAGLGITPERYRTLDYGRTQEIADAAAFLGFDGIMAPSARWDCLNLILFSDRFAPEDLIVTGREPVDWNAWRNLRRRLQGR
jgi:hypothetical protein